MLQLNQVRCFVVLARELHFGRAAERLHMTQPPLSRQIQQLEHALGVPLFERNRRQVKLTAAGAAFLPQAEHLLQAADTAALTANRAMQGRLGAVAMGYVPGASCSLLPPLVAEITQALPDVQLDLRELSTNEQIDALRSRSIELGLIRMPFDSGEFATACVLREPFIAAVPQGHALAAKDALQTADLHRMPMVMFHPAQGGYFYELLVRVFHSVGVAPRYVQYVRQTHSLLGLVSGGLGIAVLPASTRRLSLPGVVFRPIELPAHAIAELHVVWRRGEETSRPAMEAVRQLVLAHSFS